MKQRDRLGMFSALLALAVVVTAFIVHAANECGDTICLGLPSIVSGQVTDDTYYSGSIKLASTYHDGDLITNKSGYYTLDGTQWTATPTPNTAILNEVGPSGSVAPFSDGSFIAAWQDGTAIYIKQFDKTGAPAGSKTAVVTGLPAGTYSPTVLAQVNDNYVVFWSTASNIQYKMYSRQDVLLRAVTVYTGDASNSVLGYRAALTSGGAVALLAKRLHQGSDWYRTYDFRKADGCTFDPERGGWWCHPIDYYYDLYVLDPATTSSFAASYTSPSISKEGGFDVGGLSTGNLVIVFQNLSASTLIRFSNSGAKIGAEQSIGDSAANPKISSAPNGDQFVVWENSSQVYGQKFDLNGVAIGANFSIVSGSIGDITYVEDGYFLLSSISGGVLKFTRVNADRTIVPGTLAFPYGSLTSAGLFTAGSTGVVTPISTSGMGLLSSEKMMSSGIITPASDLFVQFKLVEPVSSTQWLSPTRNYLYANNSDGRNGSITYANGYSNASTAPIHVDMSCASCTALQVYESFAPLSGSACGAYGGWVAYGGNSTQNRDVSVPVDTNRCYRFKAVVTNTAGASYDYVSNNVLMVDRTPPAIAVTSDKTVGSQLTLNLDIQDTQSGIASQSYQVNGGITSPFAGNAITTTAVNGVNRITIEVKDNAGNVGAYDYFGLVDLIPPDIAIYGITDGGVYGTDVSFTYALTQQLTDVTMMVDGQPRSDLIGLPDGQHTVVISGYDAQGNLVQKTVTFTTDSNLFSVSLLSPQTRTYDANDIDVAFTASKPTSDVWYTLNGGPATRVMQLSGLSDGVYDLVLYAKSTDGEMASRHARFTVKNGIPALEVVSPMEGKVYPENKVSVVFGSDSPVTYKLGDKSGTITSGTVLTLPADGSYTLTLSATHPVSGNVVTQTINFATDSTDPQLTVTSPVSGLHTFSSIPITYTTNKSLIDIAYLLDGSPVATLSGLAVGAHTFTVRARDSAGRSVESQVQFTVATMDIVSPQDGQKVISNTMPPQVPFSFQASGGFTSFTVAVDQGAKQLLASAPGSTTPLPVTPGDHEIVLQGRMNEFVTSKRVHFSLGAMNVSAGQGSIGYRYENCDATTNICDVYATVRVKNSGNYDINQPITLRFEHVSGADFQTQWQTLASVAVGQSQDWALEPFKASLGDTFALAVDPYREIAGEWSGDNIYTLKFQTGQITEVAQALSNSNVYLEGVSVFNPITVQTAGSVSSVELAVNGWSFVDNDVTDGFNLLADMGLLSHTAPCVQVIARNDAQIVMDSRSVCFETKTLALGGTTPFAFPWEQFSQGSNRIDVSSLSPVDLAATVASLRYVTLQKPAAVMPMVSDGGLVDYRLIADPAAVQQQPYYQTADMGSPVIGGQMPMPNGHGLFLANIIPRDNTCRVYGAAPIMTKPRYEDLSELYQKELDQVNKLADIDVSKLSAAEGLHISAMWADGFFLTSKTNINVPDVFRTLNDVAPINIKTAWLITGFDNQIGSISEELGVEYGFDASAENCLVAADVGQVDLSMQGAYRVRVDSKSTLNINKQNINFLGAASLFAGDIPIMPMTTTIFVAGNLHIYPQSISLLAATEASVRMAVVNQRFYVGPFQSSFDASVSHRGRLADADIQLYPIFLGGFGGGKDVKVNLDINARGAADIVGGNQKGSNDFTTYAFTHALVDGNVEMCDRNKYCFMGACYNDSWNCDDTPLDSNPNGAQEVGQAYTNNDVAIAVSGIQPIDIGGISDLTSLGLYSLIVGDTQLAQEYLSCGVFKKIALNMPNGTLYSLRTGQCATVTDPDYDPVGGATYYTDAACQQQVDYKPTSFLEYCENNLLEPTNHQYIGNAAAWPNDGGAQYASIGKNSKWTLSHGPTLNVWAVSPSGNRRPFLKQVEYRDVDGCHLEMRVYKKDLTEENLKPLILIHGGAWKYRGFGAIGADVVVSHLTERGFIVFEPYYRLAGTADGPTECQIPGPINGVSPGEMIVSDIENAFTWVKANGATLGAQSGARISLVGQSAGAHLTSWLASYHGSEIEKMMVFYTPSDIQNFVQGLGSKYPTGAEGIDALQKFLGVNNLSALQVNIPPFVQANSFPEMIKNGVEFPPSFMLHGNADTLVPVEMSTRMCDALSGSDPDASPMTTEGGRYACSTRRGITNVLHIIPGADHMFDLQCFVDPALVTALGDNFKDLTRLCPSGSPATTEYRVKPAILEGLNWLQ